MKWMISGTVAMACMVAANLCHAVDRAEIVLDASVAMWETSKGDTPRIVTVRSGFNQFIQSPAIVNSQVELGLRTIGGARHLTDGSGCADSQLLIPTGTVEPAQWQGILGDLMPRGGRGLVNALEAAVEDLAGIDGDRRIVILTAGADECHRGIERVLDAVNEPDNPIEVRIVGVGIDYGLSSTLAELTPTRNASDQDTLVKMLHWAIFSTPPPPQRQQSLELKMIRGNRPVAIGELELSRSTAEEPVAAKLDAGVAKVRLEPGSYDARLVLPDQETVRLAGITLGDDDRSLDIQIWDGPPVTLEVVPHEPLRGSTAFVRYWGAPAGTNWVAFAAAGTPISDFLVRVEASATTDGVELVVPGPTADLEVRFLHQLQSGVTQLVGRHTFSAGRARVSIEISPTVEIRTQVTIGWDGPNLPGDHLTITGRDLKRADHVACIPAIGEQQAEVHAPVIPGAYVVRYVSGTGRVLARTDLEVFEVLATLDGPDTTPAGEGLSVAWWGPDATQDYICIAMAESDDDEYLSWSPTANANPAQLTAPRTPGAYELRYVRGSDGETLARQPIEVVATPIELASPRKVNAGSRFRVTWTGTVSDGDFVAVALPDAQPGDHLDWTFVSLGSPQTLAAPFDKGTYEVRYVSGSTPGIVARQTIEVR